MNTDFSPKTYFEEIGAWPQKSNILFAYCTGFVLSIIFTLAAYLLATHQSLIFELSFPVVATILVVLAGAQFITQLIFFFHLGHIRHRSRTDDASENLDSDSSSETSDDTSGSDRLIVLAFTIVIIVILVSGSLWIMFTLNQRMMPSTAQMEQYMNSQQGI
jgi:cytochrome o ubiquinol oxidase operon protein cyoD